MGVSFAVLAVLTLAGASFAETEATSPGDAGPAFAVRATERLVIRPRARVRGGAVGAIGASPSESRAPEAVVDRARVGGDVYGQAVRLTRGAKVGRVFTGAFAAEPGARYGEVLPLPQELPAPPAGLTTTSGTEDIIVPPGARVYLSGQPARVEVQAGGTLVLAGGQFQLERLTLGERSRLEVEAPSRLLVFRSFRTGPRAFVGPVARGVPFNLSIVVTGADAGSAPRVVVGERSRVRAAVSAPHGTIVLGERVRALGSYHGRVIDVGSRASVDIPPGLHFDHDVCHAMGCKLDATAGGQIDFYCGPVQLPAGTPCDDGQLCTKDDSCDADARCIGTPVVPPSDPGDVNKCIRSTCDPVYGIHEPAGAPCDALDPCREAFTCNGTGYCTQPGAPLPAGTPCDDGIPNNGADTCSASAWCHGSLGQFDCLANNCSPEPGAPPDLECWLAQHPHVKAYVQWLRLDGFVVYYDDWEPWQKASLQQALVDAWDWYAGGMTSFQGTPVPEPSPNHLALADGDYPNTVLDEELEAWPLFAASLAHSLAVEIGGWVPWSLCDYGWGSQELNLLLPSYNRYWVTGLDYDRYTVFGRATPAHVTLAFSFLSQNGLIGATRLETIANVVGWSRRLAHFYGGYTALNFEHHWQYRGEPPVSRILAGTLIDIPLYAQWHPDPEHWIAGCWGMSAFLKDLLRSVNIPVQSASACGHATPYFPSEGRYLSHGDDPYNGSFKEGATTLVPPLEEFLIDEATYAAWFGGSAEAACDNLGRRPIELMAQYPPDWLVALHCDDVAAGRDHASSLVYAELDAVFSVAELEAIGFWSTLAQRATALGYPCGT